MLLNRDLFQFLAVCTSAGMVTLRKGLGVTRVDASEGSACQEDFHVRQSGAQRFDALANELGVALADSADKDQVGFPRHDILCDTIFLAIVLAATTSAHVNRTAYFCLRNASPSFANQAERIVSATILSPNASTCKSPPSVRVRFVRCRYFQSGFGGVNSPFTISDWIFATCSSDLCGVSKIEYSGSGTSRFVVTSGGYFEGSAPFSGNFTGESFIMSARATAPVSDEKRMMAQAQGTTASVLYMALMGRFILIRRLYANAS